MQRRMKIVMDTNRYILPDQNKNYVVGQWDGTIEAAVSNAMKHNREIFVLRPEGIDLTHEELYREH